VVVSVGSVLDVSAVVAVVAVGSRVVFVGAVVLGVSSVPDVSHVSVSHDSLGVPSQAMSRAVSE
jgi:hypothetical protein